MSTLGALGAMNALAERRRRPNIVFIITDDQSWDSLGFMGGNVHTPRIDQLAKDGLWLTDFNVTSTVCSPTRYSFLTGRYAGRCEGLNFMREHPPGSQTQVENICELEPDDWNLAKVLQRNGYTTGFIGKSHIVKHDWLKVENWKAVGLETYGREADPRDPAVNAKMLRNHLKWCDEIKKYGFDYADGVYGANLRELHNEALNVHNLEWSVDKAFRFMEAHSNDPFFLYFSTTLHHGPDPWDDQYALGADPHLTGEGFVPEGFDVLPSRADVIRRNRAAGKPDDMAFALWLDDGVGALVDKIRQLGMEEDTLIVFVPDHGCYRSGKATLHDYGMRVPMLLQWKGTIKPGSTYDGLTANIDFVPTVLDLCGIAPPADYAMDGISLKPVLMGSQSPVRNMIFGELGHSRCVKSKDWKYIAVRYPEKVQRRIEHGGKFANFEDLPPLDRPYLTRNAHLGHNAAAGNPHYFEPDQLYNLRTDPEENNNIFGQYPEIATMMQQKLKKQLVQFPNRPFGEFAGEPNIRRTRKVIASAEMTIRPSNDEARMSATEVAGRGVWVTERRVGLPTYFYFKINDPSFRNGKHPIVDVEIEYLDAGNTEVLVEYDAEGGAFRKADSFWVGGSKDWKTLTIELSDARFSGRCNGGDFRLGFHRPDTDPVVFKATVLQVE